MLEFPGGLRVKNLALSLLWAGLVPHPGTCVYGRCSQKKKKKREKKKGKEKDKKKKKRKKKRKRKGKRKKKNC